MARKNRLLKHLNRHKTISVIFRATEAPATRLPREANLLSSFNQQTGDAPAPDLPLAVARLIRPELAKTPLEQPLSGKSPSTTLPVPEALPVQTPTVQKLPPRPVQKTTPPVLPAAQEKPGKAGPALDDREWKRLQAILRRHEEETANEAVLPEPAPEINPADAQISPQKSERLIKNSPPIPQADEVSRSPSTLVESASQTEPLSQVKKEAPQADVKQTSSRMEASVQLPQPESETDEIETLKEETPPAKMVERDSNQIVGGQGVTRQQPIQAESGLSPRNVQAEVSRAPELTEPPQFETRPQPVDPHFQPPPLPETGSEILDPFQSSTALTQEIRIPPPAEQDREAQTGSTPPLQEIWPVESPGSRSIHTPPTPVEPVYQPLSPEIADERPLLQALKNVIPGQPSESSIEVIPPRRPRPAPVQQIPAPNPTHMDKTSVEKLDGPRETIQQSSPPIPPSAPGLVSTEIGALPADLWKLIGEEAPTEPHESPIPEEESSKKTKHMDDSGHTPLPGREALVSKSSSLLTSPLVQPVVQMSPAPENMSPAPGVEPEQPPTQKQPGEVDIEELARRVYAEIKRRLSIEWERIRGRRL